MTYLGTRPRDVIAIGCSAGGLEALGRIVKQLPRDLPAAIVVVQHLAATPHPYLVTLLQRGSSMPVVWAEQGIQIEYGTIYVAPPDAHVVFQDAHLALTRGPPENHARPSIDKLFRSAAAAHGDRAVGVLLTGILYDGVAGLDAIKVAGGYTIVQDPTDAEFPELPARALQAIRPDRVLPLDAIGGALRQVAGEPVTPGEVPARVTLEAQLDVDPRMTPHPPGNPGPQTTLACPECHGPLRQVGDGRLSRFRCDLGHPHTAGDLLALSRGEIEAALWAAIRALVDRAATFELLAGDSARAGQSQVAEIYASRAREARQHAEVARSFMVDLAAPAPDVVS